MDKNDGKVNPHYVGFYNRHVDESLSTPAFFEDRMRPLVITPQGNIYNNVGLRNEDVYGTRWLAIDKNTFFELLARHSIHRADLIAEGVGKLEEAVLSYYQVLKDAYTRLRKRPRAKKRFVYRVNKEKHQVTLRPAPPQLLRYFEMPIAYEVSDWYIMFEDKQSLAMAVYMNQAPRRSNKVKSRVVKEYCQKNDTVFPKIIDDQTKAQLVKGVRASSERRIREAHERELRRKYKRLRNLARYQKQIGTFTSMEDIKKELNITEPEPPEEPDNANEVPEPEENEFPFLIDPRLADYMANRVFKQNNVVSTLYFTDTKYSQLTVGLEALVFMETVAVNLTRNIMSQILLLRSLEYRTDAEVEERDVFRAINQMQFADPERIFLGVRFWAKLSQRLKIPIIYDEYVTKTNPDRYMVLTPEEYERDVHFNWNRSQVYKFIRAQSAKDTYFKRFVKREPPVVPSLTAVDRVVDEVVTVSDLKLPEPQTTDETTIEDDPQMEPVLDALQKLEEKFLDRKDARDSRMHEHALLTMMRTGLDLPDASMDEISEDFDIWTGNEHDEHLGMLEFYDEEANPQRRRAFYEFLRAHDTEGRETRPWERVEVEGDNENGEGAVKQENGNGEEEEYFDDDEEEEEEVEEEEKDQIEELVNNEIKPKVKVTPALLEWFEGEYANYDHRDEIEDEMEVEGEEEG